ncbi:hypothetical protein PENTCL1PPCAC_12850, partial [Pristionchus entomophagus]
TCSLHAGEPEIDNDGVQIFQVEMRIRRHFTQVRLHEVDWFVAGVVGVRHFVHFLFDELINLGNVGHRSFVSSSA